MQSTRRVPAPAAADVVVITRLRCAPDGRKERSRGGRTTREKSASADGRGRGRTDGHARRERERRESGADRTGLISHLGVTRAGAGAGDGGGRRNDGAHSLFSLSLSLSFFPSTTISLCLKPTSERVSFTCSRKLLCGVSQSGGQPGAGGAAGVGDPQIHCNEWRTADRPTDRPAGKYYLCLH